jgi:hypothetical protein
MARINVERNSSRGERSRRGSGRNNGAPVEFELARFCVPSFGSARVAYGPPRRLPRAGDFRALVTPAQPRPISPTWFGSPSAKPRLTPALFSRC